MSSIGFGSGALDAAANKRELDITINQRLNAQFTDRDGAGGAQQHYRDSLTMISNDISSFARFLTHSFCLEVLLFWKEVEQYKSLFSPDEKKVMFKKIYELYCMPGATWQVNFRGEYFKDIDNAMKENQTGDIDFEEDVFDKAQEEVYELMRLDLFPRFCEHLAAIGRGGETDEVRAPDMKSVLSGTNPPATRSFTRFTREQLCEEALLFWIEANDFALLFQKLDLQSRAKAIYETYLSASAKYKVNVSDRIIKPIADAIGANDDRVTNALFLEAQRDVNVFLEQDLFPRYQEWCDEREASGAATRGAGAPAPLAADVAALSGDKEAKRSACAAVLQGPEEGLNKMRQVAEDLDAGENIDFYVDVRQYKLLFQEDDRRNTAARLYDRYVDPNSNRLVTFSDDVAQGLHAAVREQKSAAPDIFEKAEREVLNLITDNIYPKYAKAVAAEQSVTVTRTAPIEPPNTGGCCTIL